jgi:zinc protease
MTELATVSVPALTRPARQKKLSTLERVTSSGLRVLAVRKPGVPLVELRLRIPVLSSKPTSPARTALLSDSVLTGVAGYDRAGLAAAVQGLGGDLNVGVDTDRVIFSANVLATNLRPMLGLLNAVLTEPTYPTAEVGAERDRLIEKLTIARSRAGVVAGEALARRLWGNHPYAHDLPEIVDVAATTAAQVRKLHSDLVRPSGAVLVVVGDISPARVLDQVEAALSDWSGTPLTGKVPPLPPIESGPPVLVDRPGSVQSSIRLGGLAVPRTDPVYPALQLANLIFGGYFSSRWNENIRESKGYTYGARSSIEHNTLGSVLLLEADVATEVTGPALLETWYELGRIASLPVIESELASVRQYAIGTMALSTATQAGLASTLVGLVAAGLDPSWLIDHPQRLGEVGVDEVSAAATRFLAPADLVTVVVGDAGKVASQLALLGPVASTDAG